MLQVVSDQSLGPPTEDVLPHSLNMEMSFLGAAMINNGLIQRTPALRPEHFFSAECQLVHKAILDLVGERQIADHRMVYSRIQGCWPHENELPCEEFLAQVARSAETIVNGESYAKGIIDLYGKRQIIAVADEMRREGYNGARASTILQRMDKAREELRSVETQDQRLTPVLPTHFAAPTVPRLIDRIFGERQMMLVYGDYSAGKSFMVIDMACQIATGGQWRMRHCMGGLVIYVAGEAGNSIQQRIQAWCMRNGVKPENMPLGVIPGPVDLMTDTADADGIAAQALNLARQMGVDIRAIVIDTVHAVCPGSEENAKDVGRFVHHVRKMQSTLNCAAILVHHSGKDKGRGSRGSNALPAAVDVEMEVVDKGGYRDVFIRKNRDGDLRDLQPFRIDTVVLTRDSYGGEITAGVHVLTIPEEEDYDTAEEKRKKANAMHRDGESISAIAKALSVSRMMVHKYLGKK